MSTIARKIDALGGEYANSQQDQAYVGGYNHGYSDALQAAAPIAELADAQIAELIEIIEDALTGNFGDLAKWAADTRRTVNGIKAERDRA